MTQKLVVSTMLSCPRFHISYILQALVIAERGCTLAEENSHDELKALVEEYGTGLVITMGIKDIENINIIDILLDCLSYIDKQILIASTRYDLGNDSLQHACYEGKSDLVQYWLNSGCFKGEQLLRNCLRSLTT